MTTEEIQGWVDWGTPIAFSALLGIAILVAGWLGGRWVERMVRRAGERGRLQPELAGFFAAIARYVVLAAAVIAALGRVGVETTSLITIFASAGLAVGLALQGSLSNFAAGVMILFFRPFAIGDRVKVAGETGVVKDIGLFATTMVTPDNDTIIVPNSAITGGNITNYTRLGTRRGQIDVGVAYGVDLREAVRVLEAAARSVPTVLADPGPGVAFVGFGASSLDLRVFVWSEVETHLDMLHAVRLAVYEGLNAAGIEIPFAQVVLHQAEVA